jgi:hypothetical protein
MTRNNLGHLNTITTSSCLCLLRKDAWQILTPERHQSACWKHWWRRKVRQRRQGRCTRQVWGTCAQQSAICGRTRALGRQVVLPAIFWMALTVCPAVTERVKKDSGCYESWPNEQGEEVLVYRHVSCLSHKPLGKGNCRPLPSCFKQGMRDLYPSTNLQTTVDPMMDRQMYTPWNNLICKRTLFYSMWDMPYLYF